jgi:3-keto-disaccharide hydrolase
MLSQEAINEQLQLLATYRRTLAVYLQQQAAIGKTFSPPALVSGIDEARGNIQRIKTVLHTTSVEVPDNPDDEETPLPRLGALRSARRTLVTTLGIAATAALLVIIGLALGFFGLSIFRRGPAAAAGATTPLQATPAPAPTPAPAATPAPVAASAAPLYEYTFADGSAGSWSGDPASWQVVRDGDRLVYQGQARDSNTTTTPPDFDVINELQNYALEARVQVVQPRPANDHQADFWFTLRAQNPTGEGWKSYEFYYFSAISAVVIGRDGIGDEYPWTQLAEKQVVIEAGKWYDIRAEGSGPRLKLFIDDKLVLEASDTRLTQGFFFINVGSGATVRFADLRIYQL